MPRGDHAYVSLARQAAILSFGSDAVDRSRLSRSDRAARRRAGKQPDPPRRRSVGSTRPATTPASSSATRRGTSALSVRHRARRLAAHHRRLQPRGRDRSARRTSTRSIRRSIRRCRSMSTPSNGCIPYGDVNRRPTRRTARPACAFPTVPIDVAAADMCGRHTGEDTVNGGYAWVLTAIGHDLPRQHQPGSRGSIKAVVHSSQTELFVPTRLGTPTRQRSSTRTVFPTVEQRVVSEADAVPEPAARSQRDELHGVARSVARARRASTYRRCSCRPAPTSNRSGRRGRRTTRPRWTTGRARPTCSSPIATPPSRRGGTSPGRGRSSARATRAS